MPPQTPRARPRDPILQAIVPLGAVPERLRVAVSRRIAEWGYTWEDVTFAGTVETSHADERWVLAISADSLHIGDPLPSGGGRASGVSVSRFSGGVIPVTDYQAYVYERLGSGPGRRPASEAPIPQAPMTADTAPAMPDRLG